MLSVSWMVLTLFFYKYWRMVPVRCFFSDVKDLLNMLQLFQHNFLIFLTNIICAYCSDWYYALASCLTPCVVISMSFIVGWRLWYLLGMHFCHECYIDWDLAYRMTFFSLGSEYRALVLLSGNMSMYWFFSRFIYEKKNYLLFGFFLYIYWTRSFVSNSKITFST